MQHIRVLLVDDEEQFVTAMAKRLRKRSFQVFQALSGEEGLRQMEASPVDVVVLDVKMPAMDGVHVLREIKLKHPSTEVVMLSGHADVEAAISGMAMGAFDYLSKPVDLEELVLKIREACRHGRK